MAYKLALKSGNKVRDIGYTSLSGGHAFQTKAEAEYVKKKLESTVFETYKKSPYKVKLIIVHMK